MQSKKRLWTGILCSIGLIILILDAQTATNGAKEGIDLCLYTVLPSLFPFIFLSSLLSPLVAGFRIKRFRAVGRICGIPEGAEPLLILGFLGGYPVGAQAITQARKHGQLSDQAAKRMLGFCSNAGPSFIFGMCSLLFKNLNTVWYLWLIHILSALLVGSILPGKQTEKCSISKPDSITMVQALKKTTWIMASICGWVLLFRILLSFLQKWLLCFTSNEFQILMGGLTELANGCVGANHLGTEGTRFIYLSIFLSFGGLCVLSQTVSVTEEVGLGYYFPGKLLQSCISFLLSYGVQLLVFDARQRCIISSVYILIAVCLGSVILFFLYSKKTVALRGKILYNNCKPNI